MKKSVVITLVVLVLIALAYWLLSRRKKSSTSQMLGDISPAISAGAAYVPIVQLPTPPGQTTNDYKTLMFLNAQGASNLGKTK